MVMCWHGVSERLCTMGAPLPGLGPRSLIRQGSLGKGAHSAGRGAGARGHTPGRGAVTQLRKAAPRPGLCGAGTKDQPSRPTPHLPAFAPSFPPLRSPLLPSLPPALGGGGGQLLPGRLGSGRLPLAGPPPPPSESSPPRPARPSGAAAAAQPRAPAPARCSLHPTARGWRGPDRSPAVTPPPVSVQTRAPAGRKPTLSLARPWVFPSLPDAGHTPLALPWEGGASRQWLPLTQPSALSLPAAPATEPPGSLENP